MREVIISSSVLILTIMAIRVLVKGKVPVKLQYALWLLVVIRLAVPGTIGSSPISVLRLLQFQIRSESDSALSAADDTNADGSLKDTGSMVSGADTGISVYLDGNASADAGAGIDEQGNIGENVSASAGIDTQRNISENAGAENNGDIIAGTGLFGSVADRADKAVHSNQEANAETAVPFTGIFKTVIYGIWILGIVITGGYMLLYQIRFTKYLAVRRKPLQEKDGQYRGLKVYTVEGLPSPCLCGKHIYLDDEMTKDAARLNHVLAHEYCHYRQLDPLWAVVRCILVSVYWFHPLVWAAAYASKQDSELACDEAAIALLGEGERYAYGRTLLSLVHEKVPKGTSIGLALTMGSSEKGIRERIGRIAKKSKPMAVVGGLAMILAAFFAVVTFTGASAKEDMQAVQEEASKLAEELKKIEEMEQEIIAEESAKMKAVEQLHNLAGENEDLEEALRSKSEAMEQLQAEIEAQQKALEEEIRQKAEKEAEAQAMQESENVISMLSSYDEMLLPPTGEGRKGEIRNLPGVLIRRPAVLCEDYLSQGEDAIIEGLYLLAGWNGREGQSMPQWVSEEVEDIISVYGMYTKEYGLRGVKIMVGEGTDKDVNNFDIPWSFLGVSRVHVFENNPGDEAPDGLPRTFAFKQLMPGSETSYINYGAEIYELYLCDRYDTGHIELSKVSEGDFAVQIKNRISCKINQEEQKVYVYDNDALIGVIGTSEVSAIEQHLVKDAAVDTDLINFILGTKVEDIRLVTTVGLQIQLQDSENVLWHHGLPVLTFPIDCGYFGPDREFTLGKAAMDATSTVNTRFESAQQ